MGLKAYIFAAFFFKKNGQWDFTKNKDISPLFKRNIAVTGLCVQYSGIQRNLLFSSIALTALAGEKGREREEDPCRYILLNIFSIRLWLLKVITILSINQTEFITRSKQVCSNRQT